MEIINQLEKVVGRTTASAISNTASCQARVVKYYFNIFLFIFFILRTIFNLINFQPSSGENQQPNASSSYSIWASSGILRNSSGSSQPTNHLGSMYR